jgi:hypothetical protein
MGRPRKNNLDYFNHEWNAGDSLRFAALHAHYGAQGWAMEARFWRLNGWIAHADGCHLDLNLDFTRPAIAQKLGMTLDEFNEFIGFLSNQKACGLIHDDNGTVWTERTQANLDSLNTARENDRNSPSRRGSGKPSTPKDGESGNDDSQGGNQGGNNHSSEENDVSGAENGGKRQGKSAVQRSEAKPSEVENSEQQGNPSPSATAGPPPLSPLSIVAVEEETTRAGYRIKPEDLRRLYDALMAKGGTTEALVWILGQLKGKRLDKPAAYLLGCIDKWGYVAKWRESLLSPAAAQADPAPAAVPCPSCADPLEPLDAGLWRCRACSRKAPEGHAVHWRGAPGSLAREEVDLAALTASLKAQQRGPMFGHPLQKDATNGNQVQQTAAAPAAGPASAEPDPFEDDLPWEGDGTPKTAEVPDLFEEEIPF